MQQRDTVPTIRKLLKEFLELLKDGVVSAKMPLKAQKWLLSRIPLNSWRMSLAWQQCLANRILNKYGSTIQAGPFAGMKYITDASEGCIVPKILGCYEEELSSTFDELLSNRYDQVIDIGHAAGYYLVGLAMRLPEAEVYGFEVDQTAINYCQQLIALNNVGSRIKLGGFCSKELLQSLIRGRTLLIVDCEGGELDLLDLQGVPGLRSCDIVVELHDMIVPNVSTILQNRFEVSHRLQKISSTARTPTIRRYPALDVLPRQVWEDATDERRGGPMEWFVLRSATLP